MALVSIGLFSLVLEGFLFALPLMSLIHEAGTADGEAKPLSAFTWERTKDLEKQKKEHD